MKDRQIVSTNLTLYESALLAAMEPEGRELEIENVRGRLADYRQKYLRQRDPRVIFTHAYEIVTERVRDKVAARDFPHRVWLARLDDKFARLYFEALDAYDHALSLETAAHKKKQGYGREIATAWKRVPRVWKKVFDIIGAGQPVQKWWPKATVIQALILPLIAHTLHDLSLAVAEIALEEATFLTAVKQGQSSQQALSAAQKLDFNWEQVMALRQFDFHIRDFLEYIHDYNKINFLLNENDFRVIHLVQKAVEKYNPILWKLDQWLRGLDEALTFHLLQLMRGLAWQDASRLVEANTPQTYRRVQDEIEQRTEYYIQFFYQPHWLPVRVMLWLARLISGPTWYWPDEETNPPRQPAQPFRTAAG